MAMTEEEKKAKKRERAKAWRESNKEKLAAQQRRWRESNKEKLAAVRKECYAANREKVIARHREYRKANKEKVAAQERRWRESNKEKLAAQQRRWEEANKEKLAAYKKEYRKANKEKVAAWQKEYCKVNREKLIARRRKRYSSNVTHRLAVNARNRVRRAIIKAGLEKSTRTIKLLGCNWAEYQQWIESQFADGMSWENQGEWHVDHTLPVMPVIKKFGEAALPIVFNYRNCQPLWAPENLSKHASMPEVQEIHPWVKEQLVALAKEQT